MKILFIVHNKLGKGAYWRSSDFARELSKRNHDITYLAAAADPHPTINVKKVNGVRIVSVPSLLNYARGSGYDPGDTIARLRWLRRDLEKNNYDLVHAFESRPANFFPVQYLRRRQIPYVSDWCDWLGRGGSVEERSNPILRSILRPVETLFEERSRPSASGVTVINTTLKHKVMDLGIPESQILILPNGANITDFYPKDRVDARKRLGLPVDVPIIAHTGPLFWRDVDLMANAFDSIHAARPDVRLLLYGYSNFDIEAKVNAPEAIIRTGQITLEEVVDYVAASTIGWIPLVNSGANAGRFPRRLWDFMSSGRAVVVTNVGDMGDIVSQYGFGLATADHSNKQAQAILDLLSDDNRREIFEKQARHTAETTFALPVITSELERFYEFILRKD